MRALSDLLEYAVELDTGSFTVATAGVILYVVRLIVRIESFMLFLTAHHQWDSKEQVNGTGHSAFIRGLDINPVQCKLIMEKRKQLREILNEQVFPMLDRWYADAAAVCSCVGAWCAVVLFGVRVCVFCFESPTDASSFPFACCRCEVAVKNNEIGQACVLHAHLTCLFSHLPPSEYNREIVCTLVSSRIFLTTHYTYDLAVTTGQKLKRVEHNDTAVATQGGLGLADTELFDLFQKTMPHIMDWLREHESAGEANQVMEAVVRVVTMTGLRTKAAIKEGKGFSGLSMPFVAASLLTSAPLCAVLRDVCSVTAGPGVSTRNLSADATAANTASNTTLNPPLKPGEDPSAAASPTTPAGSTGEVKVRYWRNMDGLNCVGRYIPDMKERTAADSAAFEKKRSYMRGEPLVDTEINIQLGYVRCAPRCVVLRVVCLTLLCLMPLVAL